MNFKVTNALARHHRQVLGLGAAARHHRQLQARFSSNLTGTQRTYQTDYLQDAQTIAIGGTGTANARLFAGAKEAAVVGINFPLASASAATSKALGLNHFDLLIDWGWFYFITKPMFLALDWFFHLFGNFGIAILLGHRAGEDCMFFPLANKSYASMAKMKAVQPQLAALKERYPDDKMKQQQEMMEIYKQGEDQPDRRLSSRPAADPGVLLALQGAVRHHRNAPRAVLRLDQGPLRARSDHALQPVRPDPVRSDARCRCSAPTSMLGIWPIIMGITMWFQMKLNPTPPDPTQKMIFDWMPLIFTFMLAGFPAGLVIYWAWNNTALGAAAEPTS